jgi:hypothetical protein
MLGSGLKSRLKILTDALDGPLGQRPLERVLREHTELLTELRNSGASWSQIAAVLGQSGVRRRDGRPLSEDHLRALASRIARAGKRTAPERVFSRRVPPAPPSPCPLPTTRQPVAPAASAHGLEVRDHREIRQRMRRSAEIRNPTEDD